MSNKTSVDRNIISDIITRLSELDMKLADTGSDATSTGTVNRKSFLFSFELHGTATAEEYARYFVFLNIVSDVIKRLGIHIGNNGYAYIMDAVKIIIDRNTHDIRLKTDIYALIACKYHIRNQSTIEHSIRNAISSAYEDHLRTPGINDMDVFVKRPSNKQFLLYVAECVQKSMCESMMRNAG